jgi:hypothetical protein
VTSRRRVEAEGGRAGGLAAGLLGHLIAGVCPTAAQDTQDSGVVADDEDVPMAPD